MKIIRALVIKDLKLNKKRTAVITIGITLAVALLVALSTLLASLQSSLVENEKQKNGEYHVIFHDVDEKTKEELEQNRALASWYELEHKGDAILAGGKNAYKPYIHLIATDRKGFEGLRIKLIKGRFPKREDEIVISDHIRTNGGVEFHLNDRLSLDVGKRIDTVYKESRDQTCPYVKGEEKVIKTEKKKYRIVGIMERPSNRLEGYSAPGYTCMTWQERAVGKCEIYACYTDAAKRHYEEVTDQIMKNKDQIYVETNDYLLHYERLWPMQGTIKTVFVLAFVVGVIIFVTFVCCIKNGFEISAIEKIRLYGMLAGIGATKRQIRRSVYLQAMILGSIGILSGMFFGVFASWILIEISKVLLQGSLGMTLQFAVSLPSMMIAVAVSVLAICLSATGSAGKAANVTPIEAIRNQKEIMDTEKHTRGLRYIARFWGISGVIAYKNMKRNKKKYRTTVISIMICTATFLTFSYFISVVIFLAGRGKVAERYSLEYDFVHQVETKPIQRELSQIEGISEQVFVKGSGADLFFPKWSEEYTNAMSKEKMPKNQKQTYIDIVALDDTAFRHYAKECQLSASLKQVILADRVRVEGYGTVEKYDYNLKDRIQLRVKETKEQAGTIELEVAGTTALRPIGYQARDMQACIFMSQSLWEKCGIGQKGMQIDQELYLCCEDTDQVQAEVKRVMEKQHIKEKDYICENVEKEKKGIQKFVLMVYIFVYGLSLVIALIGVTNIINMVSTSMQLRSQEFAMLKSVGMTSMQFKRMVQMESTFISAKALAGSVGIGWSLSAGIWRIQCAMDERIAFIPPVKETIFAIAVVWILVYSINRHSFRNIMKKNVIETIRSENL